MKINSGTILIAFFAILAGMVGAYAYRQLNRPQPVVEVAPPPPAPRERSMVVPMVSRTLEPGQEISKDDVALVRLTTTQLDEMGLTGKAFMTRADQIIGKRVKTELRRGSTFDTRDFYPLGKGPGIAHRLKPGLRAVTVSMSPINALLGFAGAGQNVDVLFHYTHGFGGGNTEDSRNLPEATVTGYIPNRRRNRGSESNVHGATATLVQGAEILALNHLSSPTDQSSGISPEQETLVTLAVYPREAEMLRVADQHGDLSLALRNPTDNDPVPLVDPRTVDEIIDIRSGVREMEIYRGKDLSRMQFASRGGVNRRLVDGTRDNKLGEQIAEAKRRAKARLKESGGRDGNSTDDQGESLSAGFEPPDHRNLELAPVLEAPVGQPVVPSDVDANSFNHNGVQLRSPQSRGW